MHWRMGRALAACALLHCGGAGSGAPAGDAAAPDDGELGSDGGSAAPGGDSQDATEASTDGAPPVTCGGGPMSLLPSWAAAYQPATEIYVSPSGSDSNDGSSPSEALQTVAAALKLLKPGVRLNFGAGTYPSGIYVQDFLGSTSSAGSIRSSDGPRAAKFQGALYLSHVKGMLIDGVELANAGANTHGFQIDSGSGLASSDLSSDIAIVRSYIHDSGLANIKVAQSQRITIIGNELGNANAAAGRDNVEFVAVDDGVVAGNVGYGAAAFDEIKGGSRNGVFFANVIHDSGTGILVGGSCTGQQFLVHTGIDYEAQNLRVWGNVISAIGGATSSAAFAVIGCQGCTVANNTVYSTTLPMTVRLLDDGFGDAMGNCTIPVHSSGVVLRDNAFAAGFHYMFNVSTDLQGGGAMTFDHNLYFDLGGADVTKTYSDIPFTGDATSLYDVDPRFVSPPADVHLAAGSPAVGEGVSIPGIPTSADGQCWAGAPDIGAY